MKCRFCGLQLIDDQKWCSLCQKKFDSKRSGCPEFRCKPLVERFERLDQKEDV
jgi:hypothetical protein